MMSDKQTPGPPPPSPILHPNSNKKNPVSTSIASASSTPLRPARTTTSATTDSNVNQVAPALNGTHATSGPTTQATKGKRRTEPPPPPDPTVMYENVRNRIAALEEATVQGEEEERRIAEEARRSVKGMSDSVVQQKYIELFQEMKRIERDHAKERQKLTKDKDSSKSQLTKANQAKTKLENLARELQKDNKKLREESKRLTMSFEDAQEEIIAMKSEMERRLEKSSSKKPVMKDSNSTDIVVKVVCKYRAELFFKISRKTKLSRLFNAWTGRMELSSSLIGPGTGSTSVETLNSSPNKPGSAQSDSTTLKTVPPTPMSFIFSHMGRTIDPEQTAEEVGIESNDEILAVEMMDLTSIDDDVPETQKQRLKKNWTENATEAKQALDEIFNGVVRERLKDVLRQYELREKHFETVIRSKELEVLLSRARAEEQKQLAEGERQIATVAETQNQQLRHQMEDMQNSQARLMDKLISCCREPTGERTQRLFAFLREELEKRGTKTPPDIPPTPSSATSTAPVLGLDVPKSIRTGSGSSGLVAPLIPSNVPALVNGANAVTG